MNTVLISVFCTAKYNSADIICSAQCPSVVSFNSDECHSAKCRAAECQSIQASLIFVGKVTASTFGAPYGAPRVRLLSLPKTLD